MILFLLIFIFLFAPPVRAGNDITITCDTDNCTASPDIPLFLESPAFPGYSVSQDLTVVNHRSHDCQLSLTTSNKGDADAMLEKISLTITQGVDTIAQQTLSQFISSSLNMGSVSPNSNNVYGWRLAVSPDLGNDYQGSISSFNLAFNFSCNDAPTPDPESRILINEIMPNPSSGDEWVEIYNDNDTAFELKGWILAKSTGTGTKVIPDIVIPGHDYYVYHLGVTNYLPNSGAVVSLAHSSDVKSRANSYGEVGNHPGISWSRKSSGWCLTQPTDGSPNNSDCLSFSRQNISAPVQSQILGISDSNPELVQSAIETSQNENTPSVAGASTCRFYWIPLLFILSFFLNSFLLRYRFKLYYQLIFINSFILFVLDYYLTTTFCNLNLAFINQYYWLGHVLGLIIPFSLKTLSKTDKISHG